MMDEKQKSELKSYIRRIEILEDDLDSVKKQKADVLKEMKDAGYNMKAVRQLLKLVKLQKSELDELDFELKNYREGLEL